MNNKIEDLLIKTNAFHDLDKPVILASGELGIYYINTEKLLMDNDEWKNFGNDSNLMIKHSHSIYKKNSNFKQVIDVLSEKINNLIKNDFTAISGGQRRDWIFSGPVAYNLGIPHISCYKDGSLPYHNNNINQAIHIADILTKGSSIYRLQDKKPEGWIPMLNNKNITVNNVLVVVSRMQGGEENLAEKNIIVDSLVKINSSFLKNFSSQPQRALKYISNPKKWSEDYLKENGALSLISFFDPKNNYLDRAKKFLDNYKPFLLSQNKLQELENTIIKNYNKNLNQLFWEDY